MNSNSLGWLIEATVEELVDLNLHPSLNGDLLVYRECLTAFHRADRVRLETLLENSEEGGLMAIMIQLRLEILAWSATTATLERAITLLEKAADWEGELIMLIATAFASQDEHEHAKNWFARAVAPLNRIGARRKALRAEMNVLAAISHLDPKRNLIPERFYIYRKAKALGEWQAAAATLLNLSREYQELGALRVALQLVNRAIAACRSNMATEIYYCSHAHKAHLLMLLSKESEALVALDVARSSKFAVAQSAVKVLEELFPSLRNERGRADKVTAMPGLLSGWRDRLKNRETRERCSKTRLGKNEEALISFVSIKPRTRFEIFEKIFGKELHPFVAENRLKNLLGRIRKKIPGLIVCEDGLYFISSDDKLARSKVRA